MTVLPFKKKRIRRPEQELQKAVYSYLRVCFPQVFPIHVPNNIPVRGKHHLGGIMKAMGVTPGVADLLIFHQDPYTQRLQCYALELKSEKGVVSDAQRAFGEKFTSMGGKYAVGRSIKEVGAIMDSWGIHSRESKT